MTSKTLKTIKLALAVFSAIIFFIFLLVGDGQSDINFLGLTMGLFNLLFFLALIALLFLAFVKYPFFKHFVSLNFPG